MPAILVITIRFSENDSSRSKYLRVLDDSQLILYRNFNDLKVGLTIKACVKTGNSPTHYRTPSRITILVQE